jgi:hypothetical protein
MRRHHHNLRPDQQLRLAAYLEAHPALQIIYRFKQLGMKMNFPQLV